MKFLSTLCIALIFINFQDVIATHYAASGEKYSHKAVLNENVFEVFWKYDPKSITFEVEVATTGWFGFGFSPNGGMAGSDIVIGGVNSDGSTYFTDRHATGTSEPILDDDQNYELLSGTEKNGTTTLRFKRNLDTCDDNDMIINGDTFRLIWAFGTTDKVSYHGPSALNRGTKSVLLLSSSTVVRDLPSENVTTWDFLVDKVNVPGKDTTYWCKGFDVPALNKKHHVIKYEPVVTPGNEALVHHILIYACYGDDVNTTGLHLRNEEKCQYMPNGIFGKYCTSTLFAWAVGGETFYFPPNAGLPFGDDQQPKFLFLEIHYDNPIEASNLVDSSGLRVTLSPKLRKYDAGMLEVGTQVDETQAVPPNQESFTTYGFCNSDCTKEGMSDQPSGVNIFAGMLHSHLLGKKLKLRHIRNGVEQSPVFEDNNYDFNYQEMAARRTEKKFLPGDEMQLECKLNSAKKTNFTYGGLRTTDEMCLAFLLYYPRANLSYCLSRPPPHTPFLDAKGISYNTTYWPSTTYVRSVIITSGEYAGQEAGAAIERMKWDAQNGKLLETAVKEASYKMICMNGGKVFENVYSGKYQNGIKIDTPYTPPARPCGSSPTKPSVTDNDPNLGVSLQYSSYMFLIVAGLLTVM